jgi:hypothetical protein
MHKSITYLSLITLRVFNHGSQFLSNISSSTRAPVQLGLELTC